MEITADNKKNGVMLNKQTFAEIRNRIDKGA